MSGTPLERSETATAPPAATPQTILIGVPLFDDDGALTDLRIVTIDSDHPTDTTPTHDSGRLATQILTDREPLVTAARRAWADGSSDPFITRRRHTDDTGVGTIACDVSTTRLGDRIILICRDIADHRLIDAAETFLRSITDSPTISAMMFRPTLDETGHVTDLETLWHNAGARRIWGDHLLDIGSTSVDIHDDDTTLIDLADIAWNNGTVNRVRRLPELGLHDVTTFSQSLQRVDGVLIEIVTDLTEHAETHEALRLAESRFSTIFDSVHDMIIVVEPHTDDDGHMTDATITYLNQTTRDTFGFDQPQPGITLTSLGFDPDGRPMRTLRAAHDSHHIEELLLDRDDHNHRLLARFDLLHITVTPIANGDLLLVGRDLSLLRRADDRLRLALSFDVMILDALSDPAAIFEIGDGDTVQVIAANGAATSWIAAPLPCSLNDLAYRPDTLATIDARIRDAIGNGTPWRDTILVSEQVTRDHDILALRLDISPIAGDRSLLVVHDVSSEVNEGREYRRQSRRDHDTGLLNSLGFIEHVDGELDADRLHGIVTVRLDQMERVEALLGPAAASTVLATAIDRIDHLAPTGAALGRQRMMSIAVTVPADTESTVADIAEAFTAAVNQPFHVDGRTIHVGAHSGYVTIPGHDDTGDDDTGDGTGTGTGPVDAAVLIARSRHAAGRAGEVNQTTIAWHPDLDDATPMRLELIDGLGAAIARHELFMVYQPVVTPSGRLLGAEALVRWQHPVHGLLPPNEFIELVENSTLLMPFTAHVMRTALTEYTASGLGGRCSVNVPPSLVSDPGFVSMVLTTLDTTGTPPTGLCIEITERGLVPTAEMVTRSIARLRRHGVCVAMDDFGTGSTSLAHLAEFGFQSIKVDRSLIDGIDTDPIKQAIVSSLVAIAATVGAEVTAEGVENTEELTMCDKLGVVALQGFGIVRPGAIDEWAHRFAGHLPPPAPAD